ncbi:cytosine permease [Actinomadura adrarensis]|uniref:Cytosine permease n=1 Tax=Actinomadura adrarensis TaxID=1819600 RepID=A0ABW3CS11_9ACTN
MSTTAQPNRRETSLRETMEDNVLNPVAEEQRVSGWALLANTAGVGTTLTMLLIGGASSYLVGVKWTLVVAAVATLFGAVIGSLTGRVSHSTGMSSTVTARFHGLGATGSLLASLVFAVMILSFLALENVLLYNGTLFMLGWEATTTNAIGIYLLLTVAWIVLALFGLKLVQRTSLWLTLIAGSLLLVLVGVALSESGLSLGHVLAVQPDSVTTGAVSNALAGMIGFAGAMALTGADFARYARAPRDVRIMAIGGNVIVNFGVVALGAILYQAGDTVVARYLQDPAHAATANAAPGATMTEKVQTLAHTNAGAYFVILAGLLGFAIMYAAQVKAQAINAYAGSLALSNLFDALFRRTPSRIVMLVLGNVIALVCVWGGVLNVLQQLLAALGVATFSLTALMVTDFYVIRRRQPASTERIEQVNWAGVIAGLLGFAVPYTLQATGIFPLGFLLTLVVTPGAYILLRRTVLPEGTGTSTTEATTALREVGEETATA